MHYAYRAHSFWEVFLAFCDLRAWRLTLSAWLAARDWNEEVEILNNDTDAKGRELAADA